MTFVASTHVTKRPSLKLAVSLSAVIESPGTRRQHPRIMETTGQVSHTGPATIPIIGDTHKVTGEGRLPDPGFRGDEQQGGVVDFAVFDLAIELV